MTLKRIGLALGAGMASALLFVVLVQGTMLAMSLAYLAPLPLMIATLVWGADVGLIAMTVACAIVAGGVDPSAAIEFGLTIALPSWALASIARLKDLRLRRHLDPATALRADPGALVLIAAGFGALVSLGALVAMIVTFGGYGKGVAAFAEKVQPALEEALTEASSLPDGVSLADVARMVVKYAPAAIAFSSALMYMLNLYAAARTAQVSQRLDRVWPDIPNRLHVPIAVAAPALLAAAVWFLAPEPFSPFASIFVAAFGLVYVLQGLAALHALSRKLPARPALIAALYLACLIAPRWVLPAIAAIGFIESFARLRARAASARPFPNRI